MTNFFRKLHPCTIAVVLLLQFVVILTIGYKVEVVGLLLACLLCDMAVNGLRSALKSIKLSLIIIAIMGVFNCIFYHAGERVFLYVNDTPLTLDALYFGFLSGSMAAALLVWFKLFNGYLNNHGIIFLIGKRFPTIALIISMVFSYYDKFVYKIEKIKEVWQSYRIKNDSKLKSTGRIFTVLFSVMLEDSVTTAHSMRARGYGKGKRSSYDEYEFRIEDALVLILTGALFVTYIIFSLIRVYIAVAMIIIPVLYNLGKELEWKYYMSKI